MLKSLEHHEHAEHLAHQADAAPLEQHASAHAAHHSRQLPALLVAVFAAALALSEQGAKHAEIRVQQDSIAAADAWAQYQAKSTRAALAKDVASILTALDPMTPAASERRAKVMAELQGDREHYERDPKDGKDATAARAREFEAARSHALEQTHAYHNGSAAMELGIVLATASAIIGSRLLVGMAVAIGLAGVVFAALGFVAPEYGAF